VNLLDVLANGVLGAENGTAAIFKRGTSTPATLYGSYDGTGAVTPTGPVDLDADGRAVWYVNEEVDVIVRNATFTPVSTFTAMVGASDVEVRSQSFTGVDYTTAQSAASYPVTLSSVLDLWKTNAGGSLDWKVKIAGVDTTLATAFGSIAGLFYNVKASAYGALGDNTTNDATAIQAAINAAAAAGGGIVYFPAGTYRITSALTLSIGVSLMGAGAIASSITIDHATANAITVSAGTAGKSSSIRGLTVTARQANSGKHISVEAGTFVNVQDCAIGSATLTTGTCIAIANANSFVRVSDCDFLHAGTGAGARGVDAAATGGAFVTGCRFTAPATWNGRLINLNVGGIVMGNIIDMSATTAGNGAGVQFGGSTFGVVAIGNFFPAAGTTTVANFGGTLPLGLAEFNSNLDPSFPSPVTTPGTTNATHAGSLALMRESLREYQDDNSTPLIVFATYYRTSEVRHTANTVQTLLIGSPPFVGADFTLVFNNDHGAASNTITVTTCAGLANFTVNANCVSIYFMKAFENVAAGAGSSTLRWGLVGSIANIPP